MEDLDKKIEGLKTQQEQAKELFVKCQGAIEVLEAMKKEAEEPKDKKDKK